MLTVIAVSGPIVTGYIDSPENTPRFLELVNIGPKKLLGEVIAIDNQTFKVQVYEDTTGLRVGDEISKKGTLLSVELGPGLMTNIFDGIQRPLKDIDQKNPIFIPSGLEIPALDRQKSWDFVPTVQIGENVSFGSKIGFVEETQAIKHWVMIPPRDALVVENGKSIGQKLKLINIQNGSFGVEQIIAEIQDESGSVFPIRLMHKWPVKIQRPIAKKITADRLLKTGQRVIDGFFPVLLGAPVTTPGAFGSGKTFTQQQIAKWSDAQIVVYVGCGERGNEMTEMVKSFPELKDPKTKLPLMDRTVLIANTSNMPIAAREASIYTGITIAEYYRDMGYDVVLMADSTSRWAEAMREVSARLGELPAEEGYPAYLSSRVAAFYDRAGAAEVLGGGNGSVTAIGTVSPAGGDMSDPMVQVSLNNSMVFLALDAGLAAKRHYPAINWTTSYSLYEEKYNQIITGIDLGAQFVSQRKIAKQILSEEEKLLEIVKIVGMEGLSGKDRLKMEIGKSLREDFLQQNGYDETDTYCSFDKMMTMMDVIISLYTACSQKLEEHTEEGFLETVFDSETINSLSQMKYKTNIEEISKLKYELIKKIGLG